MAYETKVLLAMLAEIALRTKSKEMYKAIVKFANVEGVVLKPYEEAMLEINEDE